MVYLNSESYRRFYLSNLYSLTTIFCVIMYIITFTFPFFLAFSTQNMWLRDTIYLEQPIVQIRDEAIVYALDDEVTKSYSSVAILDSTYTSKLPGVSVSSISYDDDADGRADTIKGTITMLADPTTLQALQIYLFFDYGLRDWAKVQMQDYLRFDVSSSLGIRSVDIIGDIVLNQKIVIRSSSTVRTTYNKTVFLDPYLVVNADFLAQNKSQKNYAIECDCDITSAPGLSSNSPVTVNFELHVPKQQKILYAPSILENAKLSWILYLSYLIPIYWLTQRVMNFAFRNKIFGNYVLNNLPFEKSKTD